MNFLYSLIFGQFQRTLIYISPCIMYVSAGHFYIHVESCHGDDGVKSSVVPTAATKTVFYGPWKFDDKRKPMKMYAVRLVKCWIACQDFARDTDLTHKIYVRARNHFPQEIKFRIPLMFVFLQKTK